MSVQKFEPSENTGIPDEIYEEFIIDTDVHLDLQILEELYPYMDDQIVNKLDRPMGHYQFSSIDWLPTWGNEGGGPGVDSNGAAKTGEDILQMMKNMGVDIPLVTPGLNSLPQVNYPRMKEEVCRAYNDYLLDNVTSVHENIRGHAMIPLWNPEATVEELERIGDEEDVAGAYAWFGKFWRLGNPEYDQVYEKLTDLDLPLTLHLDVASYPDPSTPNGGALRTWIEAIGFAPCMHSMMNTVNMIVTGVFDKYPDIDIVYQEGGYHWLPFMAYRMDEFYQHTPEDIQLAERMYDSGQKYLDRLPSEYLFDNFYFSTQPVCLPDSTKHYEWLLDIEQAEKTMIFATDWPHSTNDPPTWVIENSAIDEDLRESLFRGNAREVYRL